MRQIIITTAAMSYSGCVSGVRKALGASLGTFIDEVSVGSATVSYDASIASPAAIAEAIVNAGYQVRAERMLVWPSPFAVLCAPNAAPVAEPPRREMSVATMGLMRATRRQERQWRAAPPGCRTAKVSVAHLES